MDVDYNLDDEWINEFEKNDKLYQDFYKDDLYYVNLKVVYINRENEIEKIKHQPLLLKRKNQIFCEELLGILKRNSIDNEKRYTLLSILKYNILLEPDDVKSYLVNDKHKTEYLTVVKHIDTIVFEKSISMFHDLNDIILIFYEKSKKLKNREYSKNTKKIYLRHVNRKKTIRKLYED